jgi:hypothetical protein
VVVIGADNGAASATPEIELAENGYQAVEGEMSLA